MPANNDKRSVIEAAKSGRSSCRICRNKIEKETIRVGIPAEFTLPDGRTVSSFRYYHPTCVPYDKIKVVLDTLNTVNSLEKKARDKIKKELEALQEKGERTDGTDILTRKPFIEKSRSGRGKCRTCDKKIEKDVFRVAEPSQVELPDGRRIFGSKLFHITCFLDTASDSNTIFQNLIDTSLLRKSITSEESTNLKQEFGEYLIQDDSVDAILAIITEEPVKIQSLKLEAKNKGITFKKVKLAINKGLREGIYFQPSDETIQKL